MNDAPTNAKHHLPRTNNAKAWSRIAWDKCFRYVQNLQFRIAKAVKEKQWTQVRSCQEILLASFSAKLCAVKKAAGNSGKHTPGIDQVVWESASQKYQAAQSLTFDHYTPAPLRRVYIPKSNGQVRPLGIPTMKDRAMQALFLLALEPVAETQADPHSHGFRHFRSTADAIEQCSRVLSSQSAPVWIYEGDIKGCFDHIDHDWLCDHVSLHPEVIRKWLKVGFVESHSWFPTESGTPQGGIISPVLANMALDGLEAKLRTILPFPKNEHQIHYVRYADDFIITGRSKEFLENEVTPIVKQHFMERELELSEAKTKITHIEEGFDFLGQHLQKYDNRLFIRPSRKSIRHYRDKVYAIVQMYKNAPQSMLISQLNPIVSGWANYQAHIDSRKTFFELDYFLWDLLWGWAKRKHPTKTLRWIKDRYFVCVGNQVGYFQDQYEMVEGRLCTRKPQKDRYGRTKPHPTLLRMADIPCTRHILIEPNANPFDPRWTQYFSKRQGDRKKFASRRVISSSPSSYTPHAAEKTQSSPPDQTRHI